MRKRIDYCERMFSTDECLYMRDPLGLWMQSSPSSLVHGFVCPGSIDITKNSAFRGDMYSIEDFGRQLACGPPEGFAPYFEEGRHPLFLFDMNSQSYSFMIGARITEVYKTI